MLKDGGYNIDQQDGTEKYIFVQDGEVLGASLINRETGDFIKEIDIRQEDLLKEVEQEIKDREPIDETLLEIKGNLQDGTYYLEHGGRVENQEDQQYEAYKFRNGRVQSAHLVGDSKTEMHSREELNQDELQTEILLKTWGYIEENCPGYDLDYMRYEEAWREAEIADAEYTIPHGYGGGRNIITVEDGQIKSAIKEDEHGNQQPIHKNKNVIEHHEAQQEVKEYLQRHIYYKEEIERSEELTRQIIRERELERNQEPQEQESKKDISYDDVPF